MFPTIIQDRFYLQYDVLQYITVTFTYKLYIFYLNLLVVYYITIII